MHEFRTDMISGTLMSDAFAEYFERHSPIYSGLEGRITVFNQTVPTPDETDSATQLHVSVLVFVLPAVISTLLRL